MFETGYKRTGDIQPARISAEAKAGNISQLYAKRLYLPDWRKEAIERNPQCRTRGERNRVSNRRRCAADVNEPMGIRTVLKRIERAEEALKAQSIFSQDCICFPEKEQPFSCSAFEEPVAAQVKCPLHGDRFKRPQFFIHIASWRRAQESARRQHLSAQYRKKRQKTARFSSSSRTEPSASFSQA